jgi:hypothetical protein
MSTILRRRRTSQGCGVLIPTVQHYFETGNIAVQPGDNPWTRLALLDSNAEAARVVWLQGDQDGARALLARCPGRPGWFVQ